MLILYLADLIVSSTFPVRLANAGAVYIRQPLKSVLISDGKNSKKVNEKCRKQHIFVYFTPIRASILMPYTGQ